MVVDWMPPKSSKFSLICEPRWADWKWPTKHPDPCDTCPLYKPCVVDGYFPSALSKERMIMWRNNLNTAAELMGE